MEREERSAIAIASNEPDRWTKTFTDPRLCAAIVDQAHLRRTDHRDRHNLLLAGLWPQATRRQLSDQRRQVAVLAGTVLGMLVTDLNHFLDLSEDTPGPARRLAEHLGNIVRAATAGDAGTAWESALPCRRRPANRRCLGRMIVLRTEAGSPIRWQCSVCDDQGVISNWEDSPFDLRRRQLTLAEAVNQIVIPDVVAAALRGLQLLDTDCERVVFRILARNGHAILAATHDDLEELIGFVAAEATNESSRRRRQRLDAAYDVLKAAAETPDGW
jgi:hypothetical protein